MVTAVSAEALEVVWLHKILHFARVLCKFGHPATAIEVIHGLNDGCPLCVRLGILHKLRESLFWNINGGFHAST
jgi:hypothetical protein